MNYDDRYHGAVKVRDALANSYNVPAVKTLNYVGIYDDPTTEGKEGLVSMAERLGITTLTRDDYGLALTLGGGDVSLYELPTPMQCSPIREMMCRFIRSHESRTISVKSSISMKPNRVSRSFEWNMRT